MSGFDQFEESVRDETSSHRGDSGIALGIVIVGLAIVFGLGYLAGDHFGAQRSKDSIWLRTEDERQLTKELKNDYLETKAAVSRAVERMEELEHMRSLTQDGIGYLENQKPDSALKVLRSLDEEIDGALRKLSSTVSAKGLTSNSDEWQARLLLKLPPQELERWIELDEQSKSDSL